MPQRGSRPRGWAYPFTTTVVSPGGREDLELALEPNANPAGKTFQEALFSQVIPATAFEVDDVDAEYTRLRQKGVEFTVPPKKAGVVVRSAVFSDRCGNLIQLHRALQNAGAA